MLIKFILQLFKRVYEYIKRILTGGIVTPPPPPPPLPDDVSDDFEKFRPKVDRVILRDKNVTIEIERLFEEKPHKKIINLQKEVARILLSLVGSDYLPGMLLEFLKRADAFQALVLQFLPAINFDYNRLLKDEAEQKLLQEMFGILFEAEQIRKKEKRIKVEPVYRAISTHIVSKAEASIENMQRLAELTKWLDKGFSFSFPEYRDLYEDIIDLVHEWNNKIEVDIAEEYVLRAEKAYERCVENYNHYIKVVENIQSLILWIREHVSVEDKYYSIVVAIVKEVKEIQDEIEVGKIKLKLGVERLWERFSDLKELYEGYFKKFGGWKGKSDLLTEEELREYFRKLELRYPDDILATFII